MLKTKFFILFLLAASGLFSQTITPVKDFGINDGNLKMYIYVPVNLNHSNQIPLVLVLHGCTQSAEMVANETGWNKLADSLHFIVVYPEQRQINNVGKCFNYFLGFKAKKDKGEVASIRQMISYCFTNYPIDSTKVFITGLSAGGGMSNAMLNAYPRLFNAGALLAAPSKILNTNEDAPEIQPRIAILQGEDDKVVVKNNADKIEKQWLKKHQLTDTLEVKTNYLDNPLLSARFYSNANKELKIVSIRAEGVRHKLLIKPGNSLQEGGTMDFYTKDINFHSTYWIADFFGLVPHQ